MPTPTQSPTSSSTTTSPFNTLALPSSAPPSWYESIAKARSAILSLSSLLPSSTSTLLSSLADSDRPSLSLLGSTDAYFAISTSLSSSISAGSGNDPLCHWLYDTYLSPDHDLRLIPLSFLPVISSLYLARLPAQQSPLSGFEAVILAIYSSEVKSRGGKALLVSVPDLSLPSLYHSPPKPAPVVSNPRSPRSPPPKLIPPPSPSVSVLSPPLEPQIAIKSTKRAAILAACFDAYYSKIALMPPCSKVDLCNAISSWAGQYCPCQYNLENNNEESHHSDINLSSFSSPSSSSSSIELNKTLEEEDDTAISNELITLHLEDGEASSNGSKTGSRIPLPWDLLQPLMRILGHCLFAPMNSKEVRDAASVAVRCVYARASHELIPQAILASRSLIQLDKSARDAAKALALVGPQSSSVAGSNATTPSKQRHNELMLISK